MRAICLCLGLVVGLLCTTGLTRPVFAADDITVCPHGCDYETIQAAIDAAAPNATIHVAPGLYVEHLTFYARELTLRGEDAATTIISGNNSGRVLFLYANSVVTIANLTVRNGKVVDNQGGGIYNDGTLVIDHGRILANYASMAGGGIANFGALVIRDSTLAGNQTPGNGGAIVNGGRLTIAASTLADNYAAARGGAVYHSVGALIMTGSRVVHNRAGFAGGGIANFDRTIIANSAISGNRTPGAGGGILNGGQATLLNLTVTGNHAGDGDSFYNGGALVMSAAAMVGGSGGASVNCTNWGVVFLIKPHPPQASGCEMISPANWILHSVR